MSSVCVVCSYIWEKVYVQYNYMRDGLLTVIFKGEGVLRS